MADFVIKSPAWKDGEFIQEKFTCDGENLSPMLELKSAPEGTKSLALIMDDPDARLPAHERSDGGQAPGGVWVHWLLWNIPPNTQYISEDTLPSGAVEGTTSFGKPGYGGPCPPRGHGPHRYFFKVYALDAELDLSHGATKEELKTAMADHILAEAKLMGRYARQ